MNVNSPSVYKLIVPAKYEQAISRFICSNTLGGYYFNFENSPGKIFVKDYAQEGKKQILLFFNKFTGLFNRLDSERLSGLEPQLKNKDIIKHFADREINPKQTFTVNDENDVNKIFNETIFPEQGIQGK